MSENIAEVRAGYVAPTQQDLADIVALKDDVHRNLWITQRYFDLSLGLRLVIDPDNANWSTFATWASKTAGQSIRNEEVPEFFRAQLGLEQRLENKVRGLRLMKWMGLLGFVRDAIVATLRDVSTQVADGNRKVFEELGPLFASFIELMQAGGDDASLERFIDALKPGLPTEDGTQDGQDLLKKAFRNYHHAATVGADEAEGDGPQSGPSKAELILLANCQIGLHEQTRLQANIKGAMDAPIDTIFTGHLHRLLPAFIGRPVAAILHMLAKPFIKDVKELWELVATRYAMNLTLPEGKEIPLGHDLPDVPQEYPPALRELDLPALRTLVETYDLDLDSTAASGANNWSDLKDRMGFIVELFRSRQQHPELFDPPFSDSQLAQLAAGQTPTGTL